VKELRLAGISDAAGANVFLPGFLAQYNARFGKPPRSDEDAHRPISAASPLEDVFAWKEERTLTNNLTCSMTRCCSCSSRMRLRAPSPASA